MFKWFSKIWDRLKTWWEKHKLNKIQRKRYDDRRKFEEYSRLKEKYCNNLQEEQQRQEYLNRMYDIKRTTYTKKMVTWILAICIIDVQAVFVMAIFDKGTHLEGIVNNLTNTIIAVSFIYMIRAYYDSKAEHKNMDDYKIAALKNSLSGKITNILQAAGVTNITGEQFLDSSLEEDKTSRKFQIDINGVNISAGREAKPKPDLTSLARLSELNKQLRSKRPPNVTTISPTSTESETPTDSVG